MIYQMIPWIINPTTMPTMPPKTVFWDTPPPLLTSANLIALSVTSFICSKFLLTATISLSLISIIFWLISFSRFSSSSNSDLLAREDFSSVMVLVCSLTKSSRMGWRWIHSSNFLRLGRSVSTMTFDVDSSAPQIFQEPVRIRRGNNIIKTILEIIYPPR